MYTELYLAVEISKETPENIINWCREDEPLEELAGTRLDTFGHSSSYYFDGIAFKQFEYDDITKSYFLTTRFDVKNYSQEIQHMLLILSPHILSRGHIGHIRYEEDELPTLLILEEGVIKFIDVNK